MTDSGNSDGEWISKIDMQNNVAGLPYEIYVIDKEVGAPHGRFRIALAFPDVGMGQFMRISSLPTVIIETMSAVAARKSSPAVTPGSKPGLCCQKGRRLRRPFCWPRDWPVCDGSYKH